jgi:hypothetical protein
MAAVGGFKVVVPDVVQAREPFIVTLVPHPPISDRMDEGDQKYELQIRVGEHPYLSHAYGTFCTFPKPH